MTMYQLTDSAVVRLADNAWIPAEPKNCDFQAYLEWVGEGNTATPAAVPPTPVELTPAEKLAAAGLTVDELRALLGL
jgi:hypothetical protein